MATLELCQSIRRSVGVCQEMRSERGSIHSSQELRLRLIMKMAQIRRPGRPGDDIQEPEVNGVCFYDCSNPIDEDLHANLQLRVSHEFIA